MKKVFVIDWVLVPLFAASVFTGFGLHIAGQGDSHGVWHNWAVAHIVSCLLFTVFVLWHVKMHWAGTKVFSGQGRAAGGNLRAVRGSDLESLAEPVAAGAGSLLRSRCCLRL